MNEQTSSSHPLKAIASKFEARETRQGPPEPKRPDDLRTSFSWPVLSPQSIQSPAVLIDNELRVVWQNESARTRLWLLPASAEDEKIVHLFDLLLSSHFRSQVVNWAEWTTFFLRQALPLIKAQDLNHLAEQRSEKERELLNPLLKDPEIFSAQIPPVMGIRQSLRDKAADTPFWVVGTTFDKGRLLVFEDRRDDRERLGALRTTDLHQRFAEIRRQPVPLRKMLYVLAARLNDIDRLQAEMLDEEFSVLLQRIWEQTIEVIERNNGVATHDTGRGLMGFFLPPDAPSEYNPLSVIQCALELKMRMGELAREFKIRKGWLHDLELNIGLDAGEEFLIVLPSALGENLIPSGDLVQMAASLAQLGVNGQIWATKALISQIPSKDLKKVRFGVFRSNNNRQHFIARSFLRFRELPESSRCEMSGARPLTQIFDCSSSE